MNTQISYKVTIKAILTLTLIIGIAVSAYPESINKKASIQLFIVSDSKIEGAKYINTAQNPDVGYIKSTPDLEITEIKNVEASSAPSISTQYDYDGNVKSKEESTRYYVAIDLSSKDAMKISKLTKENIGKRVAIMYGDELLKAPIIREPIEGGKLSINTKDKEEAEKLSHKFKTLIK